MMVEYQNSLPWLWPALRKLGASWDFLEYLSTALQPPQCWLLTYFQDFKFHCCWRIQNTKRVANAHISNVQSFLIMQCGGARYGRLSVNSSSGHCFPIFPIFHIHWIFHLLHLWSHFVPIHSNTMEFNYLALKPILCAKVSNVNNPIYRNGAVIYLSESYQQNWNLLWNVSHFGAIWRQSFVQNFTICIFLLESNF